MIGKRFGKLVVISECEERYKNQRKLWLCKCDCGNTTKVLTNSLNSETTKSCGCYNKEKDIKHGMYQTRIYRIHRGIKGRCYNKNNTAFSDYGGRGIYVCDEWLGDNGFINFNIWANQNGYNDYLTIDRIDNNGPYSPNNCRWVSRKDQANNRRSTYKINYGGYYFNQKEFSESFGIAIATLQNRLYKGDSINKIISEVSKCPFVIEGGDIIVN